MRFRFLERIIVTPHYHVWHHADPECRKNYANYFPFVDMIFGTFYLPDTMPKTVGLGPEAVPNSYSYHQLVPFKEINSRLSSKKSDIKFPQVIDGLNRE